MNQPSDLDKVHIERINEDNAERVFRLVETNILFLSTWMPWARDRYTMEHCREYLRCSKNEFIIMDQGMDVGVIGINISEHHQRGRLGFWLTEKAEGRGTMNAAINQLLKEFPKVIRFEATVDKENRRSIACLNRAGFCIEGLMRSYESTPESRRDHVLYSWVREHEQ